MNNNDWIDVRKRLPEEKSIGIGYSKCVLVSDCKQVWTSNWWKFLKQWNETDDDMQITHWQSLPPPSHTQAETDNWDNPMDN